MKTLLRSAIWYLQYWGMNPVFTSLWKVPLHRSWSELYGASISVSDVVKEYERVIREGKKPAGVALAPSERSRVVVVDLDIYRVDYGTPPERVASALANYFVAALTPRGGVRVAFRVPEGSYTPHRFTVRWYDEEIGEGGGTAKHLWTFPPSVACVKEEAVDEKRKCVEVKHYHFVLPDGRLVKYPWELPWRAPPEMPWDRARDIIEAELQVEIVEAELAGLAGDLKISGASGAPYIPVPCWRNLEEFKDWLETSGFPPLPPCVAAALGYEPDDYGTGMIYTGKKVPHGLRFTMGAVALFFLASLIAEFDPKELIDFIGQNLQDYPADEGEPLNTKLSRLLASIGKIIVPKYSGLGSIANNLPPDLCNRCPIEYKHPCTTFSTVEVDGKTYRRNPTLGFFSVFLIAS